MRRVMVRYKVKPDRADENIALVQRVFAELARDQPERIRYATLRLEDGVSFIHLAIIEGAENPLLAVAAFKQFSEAIKDRCSEPPVTSNVEVVGEYRLLAT